MALMGHALRHQTLVPVISCILLAAAVQAFALEPYETGIASWYGEPFHGNLTANGEVYDMYAISAAHQELPFGTIVRVTNLDTRMTVDVRINDRGPFVKNRIIDLSYAAAVEIDMIGPGTALVTLEILYMPEVPECLYNRLPDVSHYRIQVGAFADELRAQAVADRLAAHGLIPGKELSEEGLHRVFARMVPKEALDESLALLDSLGFSSVLIRGETENGGVPAELPPSN